MKKKILFLFIFLVLWRPLSIESQVVDTIQNCEVQKGRYFAVGAWTALLLPSALVDRHFQKSYKLNLIYKKKNTEDVLQYLPFASLYALKACGVENRSSWKGLLLESGCAGAITVGVTKGLKHSVHRRRPDGADNLSFPSGHSAICMMSARLLDYEYGHISPWISAAGYSTALSVSALRVEHGRHWWSDVAVGSTIGWLAAEVGCMIKEKLLDDKKGNESLWSGFTPFDQRHSVAVQALQPILLGHPKISEKRCNDLRGIQMVAEGVYALTPNIGVGTQIKNNKYWGVDTDEKVFAIHSVSFSPGFYMRKVCTPVFAINMHLQVGIDYYLNDEKSLEYMHGWRPSAAVGTNIEWLCRKSIAFRVNANYGMSMLPHRQRPIQLIHWGIGVSRYF